jgi:arylsulfatase A-like enzyme
MALGHKPFCPTPDDPEFAGWNPDLGISDSTFFPSMVKYMDKKIGLILNRVNTLGIANNTIILYVGDNGTSGEIYSMFQGTLIRGGKSHPTEYGTHVPMIAWAPNRFPAGIVNNNLVDFTDFLPTMATLANVAKPVSYGILDGTDFSAQLYGQPGTPRSQIFCHFDPHPGHSKISRWVQNTQYKKYDTLTTTSEKNKFYNFLLDPNENNPIASTARTSQEKTLCKSFDTILQTMHN